MTLGSESGCVHSRGHDESEASLSHAESSDADSMHNIRVRDRGSASLESQHMYKYTGSEARETPTSARTARGSLGDFDESLSDNMSYLRSNPTQDYKPNRSSHEYEVTSSPHNGQKRRSLRSSAPHLRDPYHVNERAPLLHRTDSAQEQKNLSQKSTFWQTWFNTVNALIGVGVLTMPLVFAQCGWIGGGFLLVVCAALTNWSGKLLTSIMARDSTLQTYADIGTYAFGPRARIGIGLLFCLEMFMVAVALLILFSDSMAALVFGQGKEPTHAALVFFKVLGFVVALPTLFVPLSFLSPVSLIGLTSILFLSLVLLVDGLVKPSPPGSLWVPSQTTLAPQWSGFGIGFGLLMSSFSAHPVIPSLYGDMQHPEHFNVMLNWAYGAAVCLYMTVASIGYLMFGPNVSDEISKDIARTPGMSVVLTTICITLLAINPVTKFGLALRPIQALFESALAQESVDEAPRLSATYRRTALSFALASAALIAAIAFPSIVRVLGFLGAFLAFLTCIFGPVLASMVVFAREHTWYRTLFDCAILGISLILCVMGTITSLHYSF